MCHDRQSKEGHQESNLPRTYQFFLIQLSREKPEDPTNPNEALSGAPCISLCLPVIILLTGQGASVQVMPMQPLLLHRHPLQLGRLSVHGLQLVGGRHGRNGALQLSGVRRTCDQHRSECEELGQVARGETQEGRDEPNSGWRNISWSWGRSPSSGFGMGPPGKGKRARRGPVASGSTRGCGLDPG